MFFSQFHFCVLIQKQKLPSSENIDQLWLSHKKEARCYLITITISSIIWEVDVLCYFFLVFYFYSSSSDLILAQQKQ